MSGGDKDRYKVICCACAENQATTQDGFCDDCVQNITSLVDVGKIRKYDTGATRDTDENKFDYEGFLCPLVLERYGAYMHQHRKQPDGEMRASDNWQKGIPQDDYIKSLFRHFHDVWKLHRGHDAREDLETALCGVIFNAMGYLHEELKKVDNTNDK